MEIPFLYYIFSDQTKIQQEMRHFRISSVIQAMRYRLSLIQFSHKHGITKSVMKYKVNPQYIFVMIAPGILSVTAPEKFNTMPTSILYSSRN